MRQFVMSEPHATAMKKFEEWAGDGSAFAEWINSSDSVDWAEAMKRLDKLRFYYKKEQ